MAIRWIKIGLAAQLVAIGAMAWNVAEAKTITIAMTEIITHPVLDATRQGVIDALAAKGYVDGKNLKIIYDNAQGSVATATQIARQFVGDKPDIIVPIATASTQAVVTATHTIPVVFATVTDPVGAKIVPRMSRPGGNVTGVVDAPPLDAHIALMKEIMPKLKTIGVPYNPGEQNSVSQIMVLRQKFPAAGIKMVEATASNTGEVLSAAQSLVGKVDAIYVPNDNTVVAAIATVIKVGTDNKLPVFAGDTDSVKAGAIATVGFNYHDVGMQAGQLVLRVINGTKPGDMDVELVKKRELYINQKAATAMGITLPDAVVKRANAM